VARSAGSGQRLQLKLLGSFTLLSEAEQVRLPPSSQRVVALLALRERPLSRVQVASTLWPDFPAERSLADLRTALWRARRAHALIVTAAGKCLCLASAIEVDVRELMSLGRPTALPPHGSAAAATKMSWAELSLDLLPDWDDDWLIDDRERVRHLRLHALEALTDQLSSCGRHAEAIQAALAALRLEPLRETAHAALIRAHLAQGNRSEAHRQYTRCREILAAELTVEPSESLQALLSVPHTRSRPVTRVGAGS